QENDAAEGVRAGDGGRTAADDERLVVEREVVRGDRAIGGDRDAVLHHDHVRGQHGRGAGGGDRRRLHVDHAAVGDVGDAVDQLVGVGDAGHERGGGIRDRAVDGDGEVDA